MSLAPTSPLNEHSRKQGARASGVGNGSNQSLYACRISRVRAENSDSLSVQNRWLLVELLPTATTMVSTTTSALEPVPSTRVWKSSTIFHAIKQSVILNFGDAGWGAVGVSLSGKQFPSSCLS